MDTFVGPFCGPFPDTSHFGQCLANLLRFPPMPALSVERVAHVLHSTPSPKAAGHDGWRYDEIWPHDLLHLLTLFYGVVERVGHWSQGLSTA